MGQFRSLLSTKMNLFLLNKTNICTDSNFIAITTLHVSGSLSAHHQEFLAVANGHHKGIKWYQSWSTSKNYWWWAERLPETCRVVISIKLEFSASVGFIHKESVTMHGHTIVKLIYTAYMKILLVPRSEECVLRLENTSCWKLHREVIAVRCENWTEEVKKVGFNPQRDMQTRRGSGGVNLLILKVGARGDAGRLPPAKSTCSDTVQEASSSPGSVRTDVEKRKFLISIGIRSPNPLAPSESLYQLR